MKILFKKTFILTTALFFFTSNMVFAVEISFEAESSNMVIGQEFKVNVLLNTNKEKINAVEGVVLFPDGLLELKEVKVANSVINFWIDPIRNCVSNRIKKLDEICFAGITPGGYVGGNGLLFSLIFLPKQTGDNVLKLMKATVLLNNELGEVAPLLTSNLYFSILNQSSNVPATSSLKSEDINAPESFVPQIANDSNIFNGKYFIVFATQDKGSDVNHFEVQESRLGIFSFLSRWYRAESPYVLQDQELKSHIFVKAVDNAGNEQIEKVSPTNSISFYENYLNMFILILVVIFFLWNIMKKNV